MLLYIVDSIKATAKQFTSNEITISKYLDSNKLFRKYFKLFSKPLVLSDTPKYILQEFLEYASNKKHSFKGENNPMFGVSLSGEANGFYGKTHSEATRINMRKAKGTSIFIYSADKSTLLHTFDSASVGGRRRPMAVCDE